MRLWDTACCRETASSATQKTIGCKRAKSTGKSGNSTHGGILLFIEHLLKYFDISYCNYPWQFDIVWCLFWAPVTLHVHLPFPHHQHQHHRHHHHHQQQQQQQQEEVQDEEDHHNHPTTATAANTNNTKTQILYQYTTNTNTNTTTNNKRNKTEQTEKQEQPCRHSSWLSRQKDPGWIRMEGNWEGYGDWERQYQYHPIPKNHFCGLFMDVYCEIESNIFFDPRTFC